ncbi:hypothetical protein JZ751_017785 [Albula glossodonta]|uniref:Rae1 protein homolog n=1 Tax=Albula glossodonta TaxID=121402 RepID=A0A8T2PPD4_9TELE|nr:hypothetical protein JZ751_017785 [Albula glossodonta]
MCQPQESVIKESPEKAHGTNASMLKRGLAMMKPAEKMPPRHDDIPGAGTVRSGPVRESQNGQNFPLHLPAFLALQTPMDETRVNLVQTDICKNGFCQNEVTRQEDNSRSAAIHRVTSSMSLFGTSSGFGSGGTSVFGSTTTDTHNPMKVRCWEVQDNGQTVPKAQQTHTGPVLDVCWSDDGSKVFTASCDKTAKMWDLNSNQAMQIAQFWDTRSPSPMMSLQMPERAYAADVASLSSSICGMGQVYPMAVVATADRGLIVYQLENQPSEFRRVESPLKHQHRCVAIFKDNQSKPTGFALGSIEGRVAIHYINPPNPAKDNFTFKCHRSNGTNTTAPQDIYAVNDISFHPVHGTLATVGSDGRFSFWDKDARTKLKTSEQLDQPITACCFNSSGNIFAYASSYDWLDVETAIYNIHIKTIKTSSSS